MRQPALRSAPRRLCLLSLLLFTWQVVWEQARYTITLGILITRLFFAQGTIRIGLQGRLLIHTVSLKLRRSARG